MAPVRPGEVLDAASDGIKQAIKIGSGILGIVEFAGKVQEVAHKKVEIEEPASDSELVTKDKSYLNITIKNKTQFPITLAPEPTYWAGGTRYHTTPQDVEPFSHMTYVPCSDDALIFNSGATGGNAFEIWLDGDTKYNFSIGWTNPVVGPYTAGIKESSSAYEGYESATSEGVSFTSSTIYESTDEKTQEKASIRFHLDVAPGRDPVFTIAQLRYRKAGWSLGGY